ncbi:hypothetical protein [Streptomyces asiaticus]|uniref:hypothetical protein n=1 Tax=Streptomyces asiaticus TaxID=114695 RepID=UPI003F671A5F
MTDETAALQERWPQILDAIKSRRRFTWIVTSQNANVLSYDGTILTLAVINQAAYDVLIGSGSRAVIEDALAEILDSQPALELVVEANTPSASARTTQESPATRVQVSVAVTAPEASASSEMSEATTPTLHLVLAQAAFLMHEQGNNQAAALLTDVEDVELAPGNQFGDWQDAVLIVPPYLVPRFTKEVTSAIQPVFEHVAGRHGLEIGGIAAAPALPDISDNWRQIIQERLVGGAASNQASRTRAKGTGPALSWDGFAFDSREEILVYEALKREQAALPQESTISIFPLPMGRVGSGNSWTPDFLVTVAGRVGIIEVDGPHHRKRYGADATRDRHWRNSGIVHIERILVEEASADADLDMLVRQFFTRLREFR